MPVPPPCLRMAILLAALAVVPTAFGGDWPQYRYDAQRSAASPDELPAQLRCAWVLELPRLKPAWPDQPKMQFDAAYEPVVAGQRMFVGSSHNDSVTAYDTRTGDTVWQFFADGPVRFAPLAWQDKLYFVSDDGYLYCLHAGDGSLAWKFRGGPSDRKVLGNERLISTWPARGAPVIAEGKIYFAAGIWPFMGIFLHALDAATGEPLWTNDGDGSMYIKQPHNTDSFAGVAPQGPLVAIGERLLVPGGRSVPACYDRASGKFLYYQLGENGKRGGGSTVAATEHFLFNGGAVFDLETEKYLDSSGDLIAFADGVLYSGRKSDLSAFDLNSAKVQPVETIDSKGNKKTITKWSLDEVGSTKTPPLTALIKAGSHLYGGSQGRVLSYKLPLADSSRDAVWEAEIEGTPASLIAAYERLFVATLEGRIYCFADSQSTPLKAKRIAPLAAASKTDDAAISRAAAILKSSEVRAGHCLMFGASDEDLILELIRQSDLRITVVEPDVAVARRLRESLQSAGLSCERAAVLAADPLHAELPPYLASLIVVGSLPPALDDQASLVQKLFESLRPYGGAACLNISADEAESLASSLKERPLAGAVWKPHGEGTLLIRQGALPGSSNWTHEHADAANSRVSKDSRVKAPLGLLWFGGSSNEDILPRHGHGPQPQVVDGRLVIQGMDLLRATDVYTGRVLWETRLPGIGALYDNTAHQPGANASGTNYISTPAGIYVAYRDACLVLDPATGKERQKFQLPLEDGAEKRPLWGYLNVDGEYLIGGADPVFDPKLVKNSSKSRPSSGSSLLDEAKALADKVLKVENDNYSSSQRLVVMDRTTGKVRWTADARSGFRHNAICLGGGRLYCIDRLSGAQLSRLKRRGEDAPHKPRLVVFDLETGKELWSTEQDVFGTWLSYSAERDVLVEAGRGTRDTLSDEAKGMRAYAAASGDVTWENKSFTGPAMIHHDTILMQGSACELLTGEKRMREHPLSGELVEWTWSRNYGCNTPMASENLLTFRSGAAGYFDLCNDGGTGNFGGFRSSCTNNLVVAGGVLSAPEYTRTCTCSYQNQTSVALVHMPEVETWTSFGSQTAKQPLRRLGINFAAPGDRKADDGTLWLEYPSVGGASPGLSIKTEPEKLEVFRRHSSQVDGQGLTWVAASGVTGLRSFKIDLAGEDDEPRRYTVRLHFLEPDDVQSGERVFDVKIQGKTAIEALDVVREAGGRNRTLLKEVAKVEAGVTLLIELIPTAQAKLPTSVLSGIEIQGEGR